MHWKDARSGAKPESAQQKISRDSQGSAMQPPLLAPPVRSSLDPRTPEFEENRAAMLEKLEEIDQLLD